jgi:hypothetical protein
MLWIARLGAYILVVAVSAFGFWYVEDVRADAEAQDCVAAWQARDDIREAIKAAATVPVEAAVAVFPNAAADRIQQLRDEAERRIVEATTSIRDPDCDLQAAHKRLR